MHLLKHSTKSRALFFHPWYERKHAFIVFMYHPPIFHPLVTICLTPLLLLSRFWNTADIFVWSMRFYSKDYDVITWTWFSLRRRHNTFKRQKCAGYEMGEVRLSWINFFIWKYKQIGYKNLIKTAILGKICITPESTPNEHQPVIFVPPADKLASRVDIRYSRYFAMCYFLCNISFQKI